MSSAREDWQKRVHDADVPETSTSPAGLPVSLLYSPPPEREDEHFRQRVGYPGQPPFVRGVDPIMYAREPWVMGMYSGKVSPSETNRRIKRLLAQGQQGFSIALDLPTQNGLDSDDPLAIGEVGKVGVPLDTVEDMIDLLDGIPLDKVAQIRTTANAIGPIMLALFVVAAEYHGYSPTDFRVMIQNDSLKEFVARGTFVFPPEPALKFSVDVIEYCSEHLPRWEPIEFCGYHIRDSGATAVQELAVSFGNAIAYLDEAVGRSLHIDDFGPSLFAFLGADIDIFEEVAKFRAARRIWDRIVSERYGAQDPRTRALNIFCYTLGSTQTAQEPFNNIARVAYQALSAILGGVQTLASSSYDEALQIPSDHAAHVSLRTQQILAYETGVTRSIDPLGGSYYVESLTDDVEAAVWAELEKIEAQGGAASVIASGWLQNYLGDAAYAMHRAIESGERRIVGVNAFTGNVPVEPELRTAKGSSDTLEDEQAQRLKAVRAARDEQHVSQALAQVTDAAAAEKNTVVPIIAAIRARASVGEVCSALAEHWGWYRDRRAH